MEQVRLESMGYEVHLEGGIEGEEKVEEMVR